MSISVKLDHAQNRLIKERLSIIAGGEELAGKLSLNTWIDPITHTLMLRPYAIENSWYTQKTGTYSKLGLAHFSLSGNWEERQDQSWAGPWLALKDSQVNETAITTQSFLKNQGFVLSWFSYGTGDSFTQLKCGWDDLGDESSGVCLHFSTDGQVEVYYDGVLVSSGKITGSRSKDVRNQRVFEVLLIPCRQRELLIYSKTGDGFSAILGHIDPSDPDPEITAAGKFWFEIVSGATQIQVAPLLFATSGFATSLETSFSLPPNLGSVKEQFSGEPFTSSILEYKIYGVPAFGGGNQSAIASAKEQDGVTDFVADGVKQNALVRVDLATTDQHFSPFVYGAQVAYRAEAQTTNSSEEYNIDNNILNLSLSVDDDPSRVVADILLKQPEKLSSEVPGLFLWQNRPIAIDEGSMRLMEGRGIPEACVINLSDDSSTFSYEVRDPWKSLEEFVFAERIVLDGIGFEEVIRFLASLSGISDFVISTHSLVIPEHYGQKSGEWNWVIEPGDSAAGVLRRLMETFAPKWMYGFRPSSLSHTCEFYAISDAELINIPEVTLYASIEDAVNIGLYSLDEAKSFVYRSLKKSLIQSQSTEVRVMGVDSQSERPIVATKLDTIAEDPTIVPSLRPENWVGEPKRMVVVDRSLSSEAVVDQVCTDLYDAHFIGKEVIEFESDLLKSASGKIVWRGDLVELYGLGMYRVRAFGCSFKFDAAGHEFREAKYIAVKEDVNEE